MDLYFIHINLDHVNQVDWFCMISNLDIHACMLQTTVILKQLKAFMTLYVILYTVY